jgi:cytochrome c553
VDGSASGWTTDKWKNLYLLLGSGSNSGQLRKITGNSTTTLTVEGFNTAVAVGDSYKIVPYSATVNSLCSACHDPHGVSTTVSDQAYALPLLKGTWMTSPYKEDAPPPVPSGDHTSKPYAGAGNYNGKPQAWGRYNTSNWNDNHPTPTQPVIKVNLDRTTFGSSTRISESDDKFAGLCLNCHNKANLTDGVKRNNGAAGFKTLDRVHEAVKGWGVNSEHSFTCSKCHQPHNSGLPRLMQTDCLDHKHRGARPSGGVPWAADKQVQGTSYRGYAHSQGSEHRGYPIGSLLGGRYSGTEATTACHVGRYSPTYDSSTPPPQWPDGNLWNNVTPW